MKAISSAGIKDKLAVTSQRMTVSGVALGRLTERGHALPLGIEVGAFCPVLAPLQTGDLSGNHFELTLGPVMHKGPLEERLCRVCKRGIVVSWPLRS